jgi:hypothetical protein
VLRLCRLVSTLLLPAALAAVAATPAAAEVTVSAKPSLYPRFQRTVTDYVSRCVPGKPLALTIDATGGEKVAIGSGKAKDGRFTASLNRRPGGGVTLRVSSSSRPGTFHIRCVPTDFPRFGAKRSGTPQAQWYVVTPNGALHRGYLAVFDSRGVPVWWRYAGSYGPWDAKVMPGGTIAWTHYVGDPFGKVGAYGYEEHRLDGSLVRRIRTVGTPTDTHELRRMPNGHNLVISYRLRSTTVDLSAYGGPQDARVYDGVVQELDGAGNVVWDWDSSEHFDLSASQRWLPRLVHDQNNRPAAERYYDLVHLNSVVPDSTGFVVSARHLDAVFHIDRTTKDVDWKLGGTDLPGKSLAVIGDPYGEEPFGGQHDANLWTDGSLTVYDNETLRDRAPRVVRYDIKPPPLGTATYREGHTDARIKGSVFAGSARKLPGGNWVTYWGGSTLVTEQTDTGQPVLSLTFRDDRWGYRAAPVEAGEVAAKSLRSGMDKMSKASR